MYRVKVPWPLAAREVIMYAFELEVFEEDLIIVLLQSVRIFFILIVLCIYNSHGRSVYVYIYTHICKWLMIYCSLLYRCLVHSLQKRLSMVLRLLIFPMPLQMWSAWILQVALRCRNCLRTVVISGDN